MNENQKRCNECNKVLPVNYRFPTCKDCYLKNKNQVDQDIFDAAGRTDQPKESWGTIDTNKMIKLPLWLVGLIFLIGIGIGAWLW